MKTQFCSILCGHNMSNWALPIGASVWYGLISRRQ